MNPVKRRLRDGQPALGLSVRFSRDPAIVQVAAVKAAQARVIAAANRAGKVAGCAGGRNAAEQVENIRSGARFIVTQSDIGLLLGAARNWAGAVRDGLAAPAADKSQA